MPKHLSSARILDDQEQLVYLGLGLLAVAKHDLPTARQEFQRASQLPNNKRRNVVGHLALAALLYNTSMYKEALQLYCRALREHPGCPAEVRVGIGACSLKLGDMAAAQAAFERVLQLDPGNADAHLGLAVIKFNSGATVQQGLADGLKLLMRAHELEPGHVGVLNLLAHLCLLRGDSDKAAALARAAYEACDNPAPLDSVRADCLCLLARAHHAMGSIQEAAKHYNAASRQDPHLPLPHLGLAQGWLSQGLHNSINASSELELAIKESPTFYDALKILGQLIYDNPEKVDKTLTTFREAAQRREDDADMWELLAELLAPRDPKGSLEAYRHVLDLHRRKQLEVKNQQEHQRASARDGKVAARTRGRGAGEEDDLFGSDDEGEGLREGEVATTLDHVVPARLLNNAAVLFYRSEMGA